MKNILQEHEILDVIKGNLEEPEFNREFKLSWKGLVEEGSLWKLFDHPERQEPFRAVAVAVSLRLTHLDLSRSS